MLARIARQSARSAVRSFQTSRVAFAEAAAAEGEATKVTLNFACPHEPIHAGTEVDMVIIPGVAGEYGMTAGHTPIVSELKPGVVQIFHDKDDKEPEQYFISGGFSCSHPNSVTDLMAVEAVKLEDIDEAAAKAGLADYQAQMDKAPADSLERAEAQIGFEVHEAMLMAIGSN